jgi:c-di-GMP-binding flagellar brake protein YcgR
MELNCLRTYPRVEVDLAVECEFPGATHYTRASTLGGGGLFLALTQQLAPDTKLTIRFQPARHLPLMRATVRVCYQIADKGVGVEFAEIQPEDRQRILRLVLHRMVEKRKYRRKPFITQVTFNSGSSLAFSRSVGGGGMFIETKEPATVGSKLKLAFNLEDGGPIVRVTAEVRYLVTNLGIGVQFVDLSPSDRRRIDDYTSQG